jgi:hypothetical protein
LLAVLAMAGSAFAQAPAPKPGTVPTIKDAKVLNMPGRVDFVSFADRETLIMSSYFWEYTRKDEAKNFERDLEWAWKVSGDTRIYDLGKGEVVWQTPRWSKDAAPEVAGGKLYFVDVAFGEEKTVTVSKHKQVQEKKGGKTVNVVKEFKVERRERSGPVVLRSLDITSRKGAGKIDLGSEVKWQNDHWAGLAADSTMLNFDILALSPDGKVVLTAKGKALDEVKTLRFDVPAGKEVALPKSGTPLLYSADGRWMIFKIAKKVKVGREMKVVEDGPYLGDAGSDAMVSKLKFPTRTAPVRGVFGGGSGEKSLAADGKDAAEPAATSGPLLAVAVTLVPKQFQGTMFGCLNGMMADPRFWAEQRASKAVTLENKRLYASMDKIHLFDARTGRLLATFARAPANVITLSGDGRYLAAAFEPQWDHLSEPIDGISERGIDEKGSIIDKARSKSSPIHVWDVTTRTLKAQLVGHVGGVRDLSFAPYGKRLASGGYDRTVRVWELGEVLK